MVGTPKSRATRRRPGAPSARRSAGIVRQLAQRRDERRAARRPARVRPQPPIARRHAADRGADDRQPVRHRLEQRERQPLRARRLHEHVAGGEERRHVLVVAAEADRQRHAGGRGLERRPLRPVADDEQAVDARRPGRARAAGRRAPSRASGGRRRRASARRRRDAERGARRRRGRRRARPRPGSATPFADDAHARRGEADLRRRTPSPPPGRRRRSRSVAPAERALERELHAPDEPPGVVPARAVRRVEHAGTPRRRATAPADHAGLRAVQVDDVGTEGAHLGARAPSAAAASPAPMPRRKGRRPDADALAPRGRRPGVAPAAPCGAASRRAPAPSASRSRPSSRRSRYESTPYSIGSLDDEERRRAHRAAARRRRATVAACASRAGRAHGARHAAARARTPSSTQKWRW